MPSASQEVGKEHTRRLQEYIRKTPPANVPRNQFGAAARRPICAALGFDDSLLSSNKRLKRLFKCLYKFLGMEASDGLPASRSDVERRLRAAISKRDKRIEALRAENKALKQASLGRNWFLPHGRMLRP